VYDYKAQDSEAGNFADLLNHTASMPAVMMLLLLRAPLAQIDLNGQHSIERGVELQQQRPISRYHHIPLLTCANAVCHELLSARSERFASADHGHLKLPGRVAVVRPVVQRPC
jgi:hypothetical protein